ncbi:MAG TPA: zinc-dependent metalloprotease, partial [Chitinophagales bacterium]|nr:zinc-dependent metalloprotease [Chitinophagales bacterium]
DMSNDAIGYAVENMEMVNKTLNGLLKKYSTTGKSYHELRNAYLTLTGNYNRSLNVVNRYIGGVYINRNMVGQDSLSKPYIPVSLADQKRAMQTLVKYAFAVNAFKTPQDLYNYLQQQRRGNERKENEDPKIHDRILNIQKSILDELLNGAVMQRLIDTKLYGNTYSLNMMLEDLTNGIFTEDLNSAVSSLRQNLQIEYVNRILAVMDNKSAYANNIKSAAFGEADKIKTWMKMNPGIDASTKSHRKYIGFLIDKAMKLD